LLIGLLSALVLWLMNRRPRPAEGRKALPFAPFLVLATYLQIFFGQAWLAWYWSLSS